MGNYSVMVEMYGVTISTYQAYIYIFFMYIFRYIYIHSKDSSPSPCVVSECNQVSYICFFLVLCQTSEGFRGSRLRYTPKEVSEHLMA